MHLSVVMFLGILLSIVGALPFGLVNLSVLDASFRHGKRQAMQIAHGAAWIEMLFGIIALYAGSIILQFTSESWLAKAMVILIPAMAGIAFFLKKNPDRIINNRRIPGFLNGVFLNLISIQVFIYWLIAIAFLNAKRFNIEPHMYIFFIMGIWTGKMLVLLAYARLSNFVFSRSQSLDKNINRIIGIALLITAAIQLIN